MNDQEKAAAFIEEHDLSGDVSVWVHDLQSELGEVAKEVLEASDYDGKDPDFDADIEDEVGDVYFSLLALADTLDIDLSTALEAALEKYSARVDETGDAGSG